MKKQTSTEQFSKTLLNEGYILIPKTLLKNQAHNRTRENWKHFSKSSHTSTTRQPLMKFHTLTYHANAGNPLSASNTGANFLNGVVQKLSVFFKRYRKRALSKSFPTRKAFSISASSTMISGPEVSLRKPAKKKRKNNPNSSIFSGTNIMKRCRNPK